MTWKTEDVLFISGIKDGGTQVEFDGIYNSKTKIFSSVTLLNIANWKYSNWSAELDRIAELSALISKYAIKVEANTTEITDLWKFFAVMNEMWESMRYLFGWVVGDRIRAIKKRCRSLLRDSTEDNIQDKVHNNLLYYRHQIYTLRQSVNLSFDLEKTRGGAFHKARKKIVQ